jgi:exodeoxyribonuclease-3
MKIVSFNINSIRARPHQIEHLRDTIDPDVIGLQETKVDDPEFPIEVINELGYHAEFWGQKGHYGVAILSKEKPINTVKGFINDSDEDQKRFIQSKFTYGKKEIIVMNGYFPQGENINHETKFPKKIKFYDDLHSHISDLKKNEKNLIIMGDFNVSPEDIDIGIGENNRKRWLQTGKCSFLPEEREWLENLKDFGLYDSYRCLYPEENNTFSWFDYRSRGFDDNPKRGLRIDHLWVTKSLKDLISSSEIDYEIRGMEKPSDHAPVWTKFNI